MANRLLPNWVQSWTELFSKTNIPEQYTIWAGIFCIAAAMQNKVWFDRGPRIIYPNLYVWIVGDPATGKSIPAEKASDMLRMIPAPSGPFVVHSGELTKIYLLKALQSSVLHKQISLLTKKELTQKAVNPTVILHSDELAAAVGEADFAKDLLKHLVQMYTVPTNYNYGTDKHGDIAVECPLINWIACTNVPWLQESIPHGSNASGLTARINTITAPFPIKPPSDIVWNNQLWNDLFNDLFLISILEGTFTLDQIATDKRTELIRVGHEKRSAIKDDIERAQWGREDDQALKVAMALSAAQRDDKIITEGLLQAAYKMVNDARENSIDLYVSASGKPQVQFKLSVLKKIRSVQLMTHTRLGSLTSHQANSDELMKAIASLIQEGLIRAHTLDTGGYYYEALEPNKKEKQNGPD